jgi:HEAT repeat protein
LGELFFISYRFSVLVSKEKHSKRTFSLMLHVGGLPVSKKEKEIKELIKELSKPGREGLQASTTLSEMGALPVLQLMRVLEEGEDEYARRLAALSLGRIGEPAVDPLLDAMNNPDPAVRRYAVEALGQIKSEPRVLGAIFQARKDPSEQVRQAAWRALERLPSRGYRRA